jgi:hypothetical protein
MKERKISLNEIYRRFENRMREEAKRFGVQERQLLDYSEQFMLYVAYSYVPDRRTFEGFIDRVNTLTSELVHSLVGKVSSR